MATGDFPLHHQTVCPQCGHCPTCGRHASPAYPAPWRQPWVAPFYPHTTPAYPVWYVGPGVGVTLTDGGSVTTGTTTVKN